MPCLTATPTFYYQRIGGIINNFAADVEKKHGKVLGVSFAIQGILSPDATTIIFGTIMGNTGLTLETISQSVHYPVHDDPRFRCLSHGRTLVRLHAHRWRCASSLERRPGGAVIAGGKLYQGPNQCNGAIEHMTLVPGGRECYCGQRGCMDTYCSPETLPEDYESIPGFFSVLEQGERHHRERMDEWLDYVAQAIVNARSIIAGDVIVGGEAAQHLEDSDIEDLKTRVIARSPFGTDHFNLRKSYCAEDQNIIGAALRFAENYLDGICGAAERGRKSRASTKSDNTSTMEV